MFPAGLATGVKTLHDRGIVHRDLKPGNILMSTEHPVARMTPLGFVAKLADFGIARFVDEKGEATTTVGTPIYAVRLFRHSETHVEYRKILAQ